MDYENFWTLVYDVQDDLKIKEAVKELHFYSLEQQMRWEKRRTILKWRTYS